MQRITQSQESILWLSFCSPFKISLVSGQQIRFAIDSLQIPSFRQAAATSNDGLYDVNEFAHRPGLFWVTVQNNCLAAMPIQSQ